MPVRHVNDHGDKGYEKFRYYSFKLRDCLCLVLMKLTHIGNVLEYQDCLPLGKVQLFLHGIIS